VLAKGQLVDLKASPGNRRACRDHRHRARQRRTRGHRERRARLGRRSSSNAPGYL